MPQPIAFVLPPAAAFHASRHVFLGFNLSLTIAIITLSLSW